MNLVGVLGQIGIIVRGLHFAFLKSHRASHRLTLYRRQQQTPTVNNTSTAGTTSTIAKQRHTHTAPQD
jgi:hypothetical protein